MKQNKVELLVGRSGTGKTEWCLASFLKGIQKTEYGLNSSSYFLVPTKEHADRIMALSVDKAALEGAFNLNILTFNQFADNLIQRCLHFSSITPFYKLLLLQRQFEKGGMRYYQDIQGVDVFLSSLSSMIGGMKELGVDPPSLLKLSKKIKDPALALKLTDIQELYRRYEKVLKEERVQDQEGLIDAFCQLKSFPIPVHFDSIYLDGFFDFSASQLKFLDKIAQFTNSLYITLTLNPDQDEERFEFAQKTKRQIESLFNLSERSFPQIKRPYSASILSLEKALSKPSVLNKYGDSSQQIAINQIAAVCGEDGGGDVLSTGDC